MSKSQVALRADRRAGAGVPEPATGGRPAVSRARRPLREAARGRADRLDGGDGGRRHGRSARDPRDRGPAVRGRDRPGRRPAVCGASWPARRQLVVGVHEGLEAAARKIPGWQRCRVHFQRTLPARAGRTRKPVVSAVARTVLAGPAAARPCPLARGRRQPAGAAPRRGRADGGGRARCPRLHGLRGAHAREAARHPPARAGEQRNPTGEPGRDLSEPRGPHPPRRALMPEQDDARAVPAATCRWKILGHCRSRYSSCEALGSVMAKSVMPRPRPYRSATHFSAVGCMHSLNGATAAGSKVFGTIRRSSVRSSRSSRIGRYGERWKQAVAIERSWQAARTSCRSSLT